MIIIFLFQERKYVGFIIVDLMCSNGFLNVFLCLNSGLILKIDNSPPTRGSSTAGERSKYDQWRSFYVYNLRSNPKKLEGENRNVQGYADLAWASHTSAIPAQAYVVKCRSSSPLYLVVGKLTGILELPQLNLEQLRWFHMSTLQHTPLGMSSLWLLQREDCT